MKCRALGFVCALAMAVLPVEAGIDVDFGANVQIGDNSSLFFSISSRYFDREPAVVEDWGRRFPNPDDLAVFFFICEHSGKRPEVIFAMRNQALTWWRIAAKVGVPADVFFVPVSRPPGPPYGRAYGYWKNHKANPKATFSLTDKDVRSLVAVRVVHDYYGVSPEVAMKARSSGRDVRTLVTEEYRKRHGKGHGKAQGNVHGKDKGKHDDERERSSHPGKGHQKHADYDCRRGQVLTE
jgi:hypothetical protein